MDSYALQKRMKRAPMSPRPAPNPLFMNDNQPEKWMLIANDAFVRLRQEEPWAMHREYIMTQVHQSLVGISKKELIRMALALGTLTAVQLGAALLLEPMVEAELEVKIPNARHVISASSTPFNLRTGFIGVPSISMIM